MERFNLSFSPPFPRSLTDEHGITVIITTHYIEEARLANLVAFMRHGSLLEEGNPESLIRRLRLNNLEEVFLALCRSKKTSEEGEGDGQSSAIIKKPLLEKDKDVEMMMMIKGGGGEEEELLSVSIQKSEGDEEAGSSSSTALPAASSTEHQCTAAIVTTSFPVPSQPPTETAVVCTTFSSEDLENGNISSSSEKTSPVITANNKTATTSAHSPTSPIFSHTQQHRKMQDAQVMANRLLMKRNAILDHFARSSALLTKNFIRMWRNLPVMLFTAFIPAVQCKHIFFLFPFILS